MALKVDALRDLKGQEFEHVVQQVLSAEALAVGLPATLEGLSFRADGLGDRGVDALIESDPPRPNQHIPGRWVFQAKTSWNPAALKRQLGEQPRAKKLLRDGAGYTLVVNQHLTPEEATPRLARALREVVGRHVKTRIVGREQFASWLERHPQLLGLVPGLSPASRHLRTFAQWEETLRPLLPWVADEPRSAAATRLSRVSGRMSVRVVGSPGVGKTRLVLEALRSRAIEVSYFPGYRAEVEELLSTDTPLRGVVIVDECSADEHDRLIRFHRSELSLVTIGTSDDRQSVRPENEIVVTPLSSVAMRSLAAGATTTVDPSVRMELAHQSGGYPKYFALLLQSVEEASVSERARLPFDRADLRRLTARLLEKDVDLEAARALAISTWVDTREGADLALLEEATGVSERQLARTIETLARKGLVGKRGHDVYVTPRLLADGLAIEFWGLFPEMRLRALIGAHADPDYLERCLERLEHSSEEGRRLLSLLAREALLARTAFTVPQLARLIAIVARERPAEALGFIRTMLREHEARGAELVPALADVAWSADMFSDAVKLIAEIVEASVADVRLDAVEDLFASHAPLTQAAGGTRLKILETLREAPGARTRMLAVQCATTCLNNALSFSAPSAHLRARSAEHRTKSDELQYRLAAAGVLAALTGDSDGGVRTAAASSATGNVRAQAFEGFPEVSAVLIEGLVRHAHDLDGVRRELKTIEEFDEVPSEVLERMRSLLAPRTLRDRFAAALSSWRLDIEPEADVARELGPLIHELLEDPNPEPCLALLSQSGPGRVHVGRRLSEVDGSRRFLGPIVEAQRVKGATFVFASSYFSTLDDRDDRLDALAADVGLAPFVLDATTRFDALDARRALRVRRLFEGGALSERWWAAAAGRYMVTSREIRSLLRPALERHPKQWLELAIDCQIASPRAAELEELEAAWLAAYSSADFLDSTWRRATEMLFSSSPKFVRHHALAELESKREFPKQLIDVASGIASPWSDFARVLERLTETEQERVARTLRTRLTRLTPREALPWIGADRRRLELVALMAPTAADHPDNLAAALLDAWPADDELARVVHEHFNRKGFPFGTLYDPSVAAIGGELSRLREFAQSSRPGLSRWAIRALRQHQELYERAREADEAERAGLHGWREPGLKISQAIYKLAEAQAGYFSAEQAKNSGCSAQLLRRYQQTRKILPVRRSIYRLAQFPAGEHEDLVVLWLWSRRRGVFSHSTALSLHGLSNIMPDRFDITLPRRLTSSRMKVPAEVRLHFAEVRAAERVALGPVWLTSIDRTLQDCAAAGVDPEIIREARAAASRRGDLR